jgi:hypothetical protein
MKQGQLAHVQVDHRNLTLKPNWTQPTHEIREESIL